MAKPDPILIVGAGPAGLALAVRLALADVPALVFEAEEKLPRDLRAGTFHPPTVELLDSIGVGQDFLAMGIKVPRWQIRGRAEGVIVEWDLSLLKDETPYPFRFHCEQFKLTPLLKARFETLGGTVKFAHRFVDATQDGSGVTARFETPGGIETVRGRYLIGADGARSAVRHLMDVAFEGFTWPERFLVIGIRQDLAPHGYTFNAYVADPVDWGAIFKMPHEGPPGLWRVLFPPDPDLSDETVLGHDFAAKGLKHFLALPGPWDIVHTNIYRVHQRVAAEFRRGRYVIVGDAAHVNNPLGAFGLNGALQATFNLGEKLAQVARGEAEEALLDKYVRQRRAANVAFVQAQSIRNKQVLEEKDPAVRQRNLDELRAIAADPVRHKEYVVRSSMIWSVRHAAGIA
ncbi:MAG TPA: FAD-dependent monooxygenase [Stellaceae bacterium]|nr:FAD-dependent monooxygenase [Stellaceae bacterium]